MGHRDTGVIGVQMGHKDPGVTGVQMGHTDPRVTKVTGAIRGLDPVKIQCSTPLRHMKPSPDKQNLLWIV